MWDIVVTVWAIQFAIAIAPGVNFALIARTAVSQSRVSAWFVAGGIVTATVIWLIAALLGLAAVIESSQALFVGLKTFGAMYLIWLGVKSWMPKRHAESAQLPIVSGRGRNYLNGLLSNLGNPKSILFYGSLFAAIIPAEASTTTRVAAAGAVLLNSIVIHGVLSTVLSGSGVRNRFETVMRPIERIFGALFVGFGLRLLKTDP